MSHLIRNPSEVGSPLSSAAISRPGYSEVLVRSAPGDAIVVPPQGCPSASGFREQVSTIEAQSASVLSACVNPLCPWGMLAQSKTPEKLTIV